MKEAEVVKDKKYKTIVAAEFGESTAEMVIDMRDHDKWKIMTPMPETDVPTEEEE